MVFALFIFLLPHQYHVYLGRWRHFQVYWFIMIYVNIRFSYNTARWTGLECLLNFVIYSNLLVPPDHFSIYTQQFYSRSTESSDLLLLNNDYVLQSAICVHHNIICSGDAGLIDFQLKKKHVLLRVL